MTLKTKKRLAMIVVAVMTMATLAITAAATNSDFSFHLSVNQYSYTSSVLKNDSDNYAVVHVTSGNLVSGDLAVFQVATNSATPVVCSAALNITSANTPTIAPHPKLYYNSGYGTYGNSYKLRCSNLGAYWFDIAGIWAP